MFAGHTLYISAKISSLKKGPKLKEQLESYGFTIVPSRTKDSVTLVENLEDVCDSFLRYLIPTA